MALQGKRSFLRFIVLTIILSFLSSCGSDPIDLNPGGNNQNGFCDETVADSSLSGEELVSADGKAKIVAGGLQFPVSASIGVDCNQAPQQIGNGYPMDIDQSTTGVQLVISYDGVNLQGAPETSLKMGVYDGPSQSWIDMQVTPNVTTKTLSLAAPVPDRYALYSDQASGGGGNNPPTRPENVQASTVGVCSIEISWDPSTDEDGDLTGYSVFRSGAIAIGTTSVLDCQGLARCVFTDNATLAQPLTTGAYRYTVRASDSKDNLSQTSSFSNQVNVQCP